MLISLIIALLSTFLWVNVTIADVLNHQPYDADKAVKFAKIKTVLVTIAALFWAIVIRYDGI